MLLVGTVIIGGLASCSGPNHPTCAEFAAMSPDTGLLSNFTQEQEDALQKALRAKGLRDDAYSLSLAAFNVIAYCNIYGGIAYSNESQPITGGLK